MKGYIGKREWTGFWRTTRKGRSYMNHGEKDWESVILPVGKRRAKIMRREQEQRESR